MNITTLVWFFLMKLGVIFSESITLELLDGSVSTEGTVVVKRGSEYGLVCDDGWDINAGNVVCKQLGYSGAVDITVANKFKTSKYGKIFLDDVKCFGYESNLGLCKHREWLTSNCHSGEAAGVVCEGQIHKVEDTTTAIDMSEPRQLEIQLKLKANFSGSTNRDVRRNQTDTNSGYSQRTRQILERAHQLLSNERTNPQPRTPNVVVSVPQRSNLSAALEGLSGYFEVNGSPSQMSASTLSFTAELNNEAPPPSQQEQQERLKVEELIDSMVYKSDQPLTPPARPYRVEIVGGKRSNEGYVKVTLDNGKTGAICSDNWGIYEAMVVCRQTGSHHAERSTLIDYFNAQNEDKVLYEVNCDGHERTLADCEYKLSDRHGVKCSKPVNVAGVVCTSAKLPDLIPNIWVLQTSVFIEEKPLYSLQCAMEENCLSSSAYTAQASSRSFGFSHLFGGFGAGTNRKLLRFSSNILNNGTADFRPQQHRSSWEWHACHQHYHSMDAFTHYDVLDSHGNRVAEGHKASFCLEDVECNWPHRKKFSCRGFADQGISIGCADVYKNDIDCQWIDITDIRPGTFVFKLTVNPNMIVPELSFDNNAAICELSYNGYSAKVTNCVVGRV